VSVSIPVYRGRFQAKQAERLLWRAGFGPRPGEAHKLSRRGLEQAVRSLTRPKGKARLHGRKPHDDDGLPLAPADAWGHDLLWWLDRMVRSNQPLAERMALTWHDWFATGEIGQAQLNLDQNALFRRAGLGTFKDLLKAVTVDPAMLVWLSGNENTKWSPNENYAREMMELFTLGADAGYTEDDVREQARSLTGWTSDWDDNVGLVNFRYEADYHDFGGKRIFGKSGKFDWRDSCRLCLEHKSHPDYFVRRLWSYFIPGDPPAKTLKGLKGLYVGRGHAIRPVVEAILMHPSMYEGPRMIKPPIVQIAGMLRARKAGVTTDAWTWIADNAGQRLFDPPNVAGWDEEHWLDTARLSGRWSAAAQVTDQVAVDEEHYDPTETAKDAIAKAMRFWGKPTLTKTTHAELLRFANRVEAAADEDWEKGAYRALRQNALRILIASSPDFQTS
jgi:uncharacterized protein (DUF1800 family)